MACQPHDKQYLSPLGESWISSGPFQGAEIYLDNPLVPLMSAHCLERAGFSCCSRFVLADARRVRRGADVAIIEIDGREAPATAELPYSPGSFPVLRLGKTRLQVR